MLSRALALLAPPLCGICAAPCPAAEAVCGRCRSALALATPSTVRITGLDEVVAACGYAGTPRRLVGALKFGGRLQLAGPAAAAIAAAAAPRDVVLVPVPPAPGRARRRGFDAADEIAVALAGITGLELRRCLSRASGPRQVGRARSERLADPPRVRLTGIAPVRAALVDDVVTTGATLAACAQALRSGGARSVAGLALCHSTGIRLGPRGQAA
jgi:ComF family protein